MNSPDQTRKARDLLTPEEYGQVLRRARLAAGFEVAADAARQAGITRHQLSRLESGDRIASWPTLHQLVMTLGLDPKLLFPKPKPKPKPTANHKAKPKRGR
jgi:transcriptional regulator with XRE-family HTH domain